MDDKRVDLFDAGTPVEGLIVPRIDREIVLGDVTMNRYIHTSIRPRLRLMPTVKKVSKFA
jgi:hypothetical protein